MTPAKIRSVRPAAVKARDIAAARRVSRHATDAITVLGETLNGEFSRAIDAIAQTTMRDLLAEFRVESQPAFLVITSDFAVAEALCDEAMMFDNGRMVERGPIAVLAKSPKEAATKALVEAARFNPPLRSGGGAERSEAEGTPSV